MLKRFGFALAGAAMGTLAGLLLEALGSPSVVTVLLAPLGMAAALYYGERTQRIRSPEELNRPVTLFGKERG